LETRSKRNIISRISSDQGLRDVSTLIIIAVITLIILSQSYQVASTQLNTAKKLSGNTRVYGNVFSSSPGLGASLDFSAQGATAQIVPAVGISYFYDKEFIYSFSSSVEVGETAKGKTQSEIQLSPSLSCGQNLTIQTPVGWKNGSEGQPALEAQNVSNSNFVASQERAISGPAVTSVLLGGVNEWPVGGAGLLIPPYSNYLFEISANGTGIVNATINAYSFTQGVGFLPFASSTKFAMNTQSYQNLTVISNGWGRFSIAINSTQILDANSPDYLPNIGSVGLWVGRGGSMNFEAVFVRSGTTMYSKIPLGSCHAIIAVPFIVTDSDSASILGPSQTTVQLLTLNETSGQCSFCSRALMSGGNNLTNLNLQIGVAYVAVVAGRVNDASNLIIISNASPFILTSDDSLHADFAVKDATITPRL